MEASLKMANSSLLELTQPLKDEKQKWRFLKVYPIQHYMDKHPCKEGHSDSPMPLLPSPTPPLLHTGDNKFALMESKFLPLRAATTEDYHFFGWETTLALKFVFLPGKQILKSKLSARKTNFHTCDTSLIILETPGNEP